jgi:hypothetical protein
MSVFLRLRPLLGDEQEGDVKLDPEDETLVRCQSSAKNGTRNGTFTFSRIFPPEVDNYTLYGQVISSLVHNVHTGRQNSLVMAYGVTNSGKTHTIIGKGEDKDEGILLLALKEICSRAEGMQVVQAQHTKQGTQADSSSAVDDNSKPAAILTIVEITLGHRNVETWRDLLSDDHDTTLRLHKTRAGVRIEGSASRPIRTAAEAREAVQEAQGRRCVAETGANQASSRSHCISIVQTTGGQFAFVDLAGAEQARRTGNTGALLDQSSAINKSLTTLGRCLTAIRDKRSHVPYRDSLLTRFLQGYIDDKQCKCSMIVAASPALECAVETIKALEFASVARKIELHTGKPALKATPHKAGLGGAEMASAMNEQQLHHDSHIATITAQVAAATIASGAAQASNMAVVEAERAMEWAQWEGELSEQQMATDAAVDDAVTDERAAGEERTEERVLQLRMERAEEHAEEVSALRAEVEEAKEELIKRNAALDTMAEEAVEAEKQAAIRLAEAVKEAVAEVTTSAALAAEEAAALVEEGRAKWRLAAQDVEELSKRNADMNESNDRLVGANEELESAVEKLEAELVQTKEGAGAALESAMRGKEQEMKREQAEEMKSAIEAVLEATIKRSSFGTASEPPPAPPSSNEPLKALVSTNALTNALAPAPAAGAAVVAEQQGGLTDENDLESGRAAIFSAVCAHTPFAWAHGSGLVVSSVRDRRMVTRKGARGVTYHDGEKWSEASQQYEREQYLLVWEGIGMTPEWQEASLVLTHSGIDDTSTATTAPTAATSMWGGVSNSTGGCIQPSIPPSIPSATPAAVGLKQEATEPLPLQPLQQSQQGGRRRASTRVKFIKCLECAGWEVSAAPPNASSVDLCVCQQASSHSSRRETGSVGTAKPRREIGSRGRRNRCSTSASASGRAARAAKRRSAIGKGTNEDEENEQCHPNSPRVQALS